MQPLDGRLVVVTRPEQQAAALAEPLRALGARVQVISALDILPPLDAAPLRNAVAHLEDYDWLIATSVNGAVAVGEEARRQGKRLDTGKLEIAAVGTATRAAFGAYGARARDAAGSTSADLAERIRHGVAHQRVLLVQGSQAPAFFAESLVSFAADVERVEGYRSVVPASLQNQIAIFAHSPEKADAATFTSAQMAMNFFRAAEAQQFTLPDDTVIAAIGSVTARALLRLGRPPQVISPEASMQSLADAIGRYFESRS